MIHLFCRAQITSFIANKILMEVFKKYAGYTDIYSKKAIAELPVHTGINDYPINLEKDK